MPKKSKEALITEAGEKGITLTGEETYMELSALLKGEEAPAKKGGSVDVYDGIIFIRTYSEEVHGKEYKKLAEQFASQVATRELK